LSGQDLAAITPITVRLTLHGRPTGDRRQRWTQRMEEKWIGCWGAPDERNSNQFQLAFTVTQLKAGVDPSWRLLQNQWWTWWRCPTQAPPDCRRSAHLHLTQRRTRTGSRTTSWPKTMY